MCCTAAIAVTSAALFLPPHELNWRGQLLDIRYVVLLGAMVRSLNPLLLMKCWHYAVVLSAAKVTI